MSGISRLAERPGVSLPFNGRFVEETRDSGRRVVDDPRTQVYLSSSSPAGFAQEKADAEKLGVYRRKVGSAEFATLLSDGRDFKWAVDVYGVLWMTLAAIGAHEIPHSIAANNEPCLSVGSAEWEQKDFKVVVNEAGLRTLILNNWTGHYGSTKDSFYRYGYPAWVSSCINIKMPGLGDFELKAGELLGAKMRRSPPPKVST